MVYASLGDEQDTERGTTMAKGHKCPTCGKNTLQPYTTNQLRCSEDGTIVQKGQVS